MSVKSRQARRAGNFLRALPRAERAERSSSNSKLELAREIRWGSVPSQDGCFSARLAALEWPSPSGALRYALRPRFFVSG